MNLKNLFHSVNMARIGIFSIVLACIPLILTFLLFEKDSRLQESFIFLCIAISILYFIISLIGWALHNKFSKGLVFGSLSLYLAIIMNIVFMTSGGVLFELFLALVLVVIYGEAGFSRIPEFITTLFYGLVFVVWIGLPLLFTTILFEVNGDIKVREGILTILGFFYLAIIVSFILR